jgi:hypothetical protein
LKFCLLYKSVLQTIKTIARTPSRVSELVAKNLILTNPD